MSASTRWSHSHGGFRYVQVSALLLIAITVTLLGGAGFAVPAAAAPQHQTGAGSAGVTPEGFEDGCFLEGGQPFEILDSSGGVSMSVCERTDGTVDECDWASDICTWGTTSVQPTPSGPLDDVSVDPDDLGGILDEGPSQPAATEPPAESATEPATGETDESATEPATGETEDDAPATEASATDLRRLFHLPNLLA